MRTIIHDLNKNEIINFKFDESDIIIDSKKCKNRCIGCFSCWIKHPKKCFYKDDYSEIVESLKKSEELVLISKCRYGCYSNQVKKVFERCIGYVLPYFKEREGFIHHKERYNNKLKLTAYYYGDIDDIDKKVIYDLVQANSINLNSSKFEVNFKGLENAYTD